jgi:Tol biopolymer transport system component
LEITTPPAADWSLTISPDGEKVVFAATTEGESRLWLRELNDVSARMLAGTQGWGARRPFWSPDSRSVGFFADGRLKRIDIDTGAVQSLATVGAVYGGGSWNADGVIVFAPTIVGPIFRIPATGGDMQEVTKREASHLGHNFPYFLPDGRHFLYWVDGTTDARGFYVGQLDSPDTRRLVATSDLGGAYVTSGKLLFVRQGVLLAQDFDLTSLQLSGDAVPVAERVAGAAMSVSSAGPIAYRTGSAAQGDIPERRLVWFDRSGRELGQVGDPMVTVSLVSLSGDGKRILVDAVGPAGSNLNIWQIETDRGVRSRLTLHASPVTDLSPVFSPDGNSIAFASNVKGVYDLWRKTLTGQGAEELLLETPHLKVPADWSPDGRFLLYTTADPSTGSDILGLPLDGGSPFEVVRTGFNESGAQLSPDGKWVAYRSDKSGRAEVYVQPFPLDQGTDRVISTGGGSQPRWGSGGRELFYIALNEQLMGVPIAPSPDGRSVVPGEPVPLFRTRVGGAVRAVFEQQYAVSRDGQRFLMATVPENPETPPIVVVLNWKSR